MPLKYHGNEDLFFVVSIPLSQEKICLNLYKNAFWLT